MLGPVMLVEELISTPYLEGRGLRESVQLHSPATARSKATELPCTHRPHWGFGSHCHQAS